MLHSIRSSAIILEYHYGALLVTVLYRMVIAVSVTFASLFAAALWHSLSTPPCACTVLAHDVAAYSSGV